MYQKILIIPLYVLTLLFSTFGTLQAETPPSSPGLSDDPGYQAFMKAAETDKFLMVHFYSGTPVPELETACKDAQDALADSLEALSIDVQNPGAAFLVEKYNLRYASVPFVMILAPNGAITGTFRTTLSAEQVKAVFHTPKTQQCLLAFQERKLVFINVQGKETSENKAALDGIRRFEKENPFYGVIELILLDPKDSSETRLLNQLRVQPDIRKAQTFLLAPPGRIVGRWAGATDPRDFATRLKALSKSCSAPSCADPNCN